MDPLTIDAGDTAWLLVATVLGLLAVPGLALFHAGWRGASGARPTLARIAVVFPVALVTWIAIGHSLAFGSDIVGLVGGFDFVALRGVGVAGRGAQAPGIPFAAFALTFAAFTPVVICGAFGARATRSACAVFAALWVALVHAPVVHWLWGGGFLATMGPLDFGGGAVHVSAGAAGLAFATALAGDSDDAGAGDARTMRLGTVLFLLGSIGLSLGSARLGGATPWMVVLCVLIAALAGAAASASIDAIRSHKLSLPYLNAGLVAGLVAIAPAAGFVSPVAASAVGAVAALAFHASVGVCRRFALGEAFVAPLLHGVAGIVGLLLTGLFAAVTWNSAGADGVFAGTPGILGVQALAVLFTMVYAALATRVLLAVIDRSICLRVSR